MIVFEDSIDVAQDPAVVFAFLADLSNLPRFQAEVVQSRVITPGPVRVGTQFEEQVRIGPFRVTAHCEVTELESPRTMGFKADSGPIRYQARFALEGSATGAKVTLAGRAQLNGLWRLMQPLLAGDVRRGVREELEAIRRNTERPSQAA